MGLGFTVETLVPAARGGGALRMGLTRVAEAEWLFPQVDLAARATAFSAQPDAVIVPPGAEPAAGEAAAMLGRSDLGDAAKSVWEDLCLVERRAGVPVLAAGAVAFPTDWNLSDKVGLPIAAVHAPIHGYAEQLSAGVDHLLSTLPVGPVFARANWFVVESDAWAYRPARPAAERFGHVDADNAGRTLFVRCERQTLRRLPKTGAVLFTIGVALARLDRLPVAVVRRVADGVAAQGAGEAGRRAAPFYAPAFAAFARALPSEKGAQIGHECIEPVVVQPMARPVVGDHAGVAEAGGASVLRGIRRPAVPPPGEQDRTFDPTP